MGYYPQATSHFCVPSATWKEVAFETCGSFPTSPPRPQPSPRAAQAAARETSKLGLCAPCHGSFTVLGTQPEKTGLSSGLGVI